MNQSATPNQPDQLVLFFKASADTLRLDILRVLRVESFGVMELCHIFGCPQPALSHHLKILSNAGLVATKREGTSIFYRRSLIPQTEPLCGLFRALFAAIDVSDIPLDTRARVDDIHHEREISSQEFFAKHTNQLKQNQDLIAEFRHYSGCMQDLLNGEDLDAHASVVEIGPGESPLLSQLTERFNNVVALDSSKDMLDRAQQSYDGDKNKITFRLGNPKDLEPQQYDLVIVNMVLHHMASPAEFFQVIAEKLKPSGKLFLMDLGPHSQDWTRDVCGDLWLGFEPEDLESWAQEAQFTTGQSAYLGLKNGFQVQLKLFHMA